MKKFVCIKNLKGDFVNKLNLNFSYGEKILYLSSTTNTLFKLLTYSEDELYNILISRSNNDKINHLCFVWPNEFELEFGL